MPAKIFKTDNALPNCERCGESTDKEAGECPHCGAILCYKCAQKKKCPCCLNRLNE